MFAVATLVFVPVQAAATQSPARAKSASVPFALRLLDKYRTLMATFEKPPNMIFTYTESRGDPTRIVTGVHRVYRDAAGFQRNETLEINGSSIRPPRVHTFQRAAWPYHADQFAVGAADYQASVAGVATVNGRRAVVYSVKRIYVAPFEITELALDPNSALPLRERYRVSTSGCNGRGEIDFAAAGPYWLPTSVSAQCDSANPTTASYKDTIRFSDYLFPAAIPADVLHPAPGVK